KVIDRIAHPEPPPRSLRGRQRAKESGVQAGTAALYIRCGGEVGEFASHVLEGDVTDGQDRQAIGPVESRPQLVQGLLGEPLRGSGGSRGGEVRREEVGSQ